MLHDHPPFQPNGPYTIAGYCPDGAASFELARQCCKAARTSAFSPFFGCPHPAFYQFGLPYWSNRVLTHARMRAALPSFEERRDYITERLAV